MAGYGNDDEDGTAADDAGRPADGGATGRMRFQDENTTPREPTLAERKARERAERRRLEEERQNELAAERSRTKRKRVLIGAGVTVGVVALIAVSYAAAQPEEEIQAQCVDDEGVIADDANCVTPATNVGSTNYGGGGFYPIFIGGGGRQYHYNYGGSGSIGDRVSGGTTTVPRSGTVTTSSGRVVAGSKSGSGSSVSGGSSTGGSVSGTGSSGSVSRGGLGSSSGGSSSGG